MCRVAAPDPVINVHTSSSQTITNTVQPNECIGMPLPSHKFLPFATCIAILSSPDTTSVVTEVPRGIKSNVYIVVSSD